MPRLAPDVNLGTLFLNLVISSVLWLRHDPKLNEKMQAQVLPDLMVPALTVNCTFLWLVHSSVFYTGSQLTISCLENSIAQLISP